MPEWFKQLGLIYLTVAMTVSISAILVGIGTFVAIIVKDMLKEQKHKGR